MLIPDKWNSLASLNNVYWLFFSQEAEEAEGPLLLDVLIMKRSVSTSMAPTNPRMPPAALWEMKAQKKCESYSEKKRDDIRVKKQILNEKKLIINNAEYKIMLETSKQMVKLDYHSSIVTK